MSGKRPYTEFETFGHLCLGLMCMALALLLVNALCVPYEPLPTAKQQEAKDE